jgi:hypothetical protein
MKTLTKREWTSWFRISILVVVIHTIILGLLNDWNIFSSYEKTIMLFKDNKDVLFNLPQTVRFEQYYPKIFDILTIPLFSLFLLFLVKKSRKDEKENIVFGLILGLVFGLGAGLDSGLGFGLILGLVFGLGAGLVLGLVFGLILGLVFGLGAGLGAGLASGLVFGLVLGLIFGLILGLVFGLYSIIKWILSKSLWERVINWFLAK